MTAKRSRKSAGARNGEGAAGAVGGVLESSLRRILRPLVRVLLRHGVTVGAFTELLKRSFVDVVREEFSEDGKAPSNSRVAVITGLTRKEVSRLVDVSPSPNSDEDEAPDHYNRAARVLTGWVRDPRYRDSRGRTASLEFDTQRGPSFSELVKRYSGDMTPRAVLDELTRVGAVSELRNGKLRLLRRGYVPTTGEAEKLSILGTDVGELIATIDHNLTNPPEDARFQRKVAYDNLPAAALPRLRALAAKDAQTLLERLDREMARADRDTAKSSGAREDDVDDRQRAVLGIYFFEEPLSPNAPNDEGQG